MIIKSHEFNKINFSENKIILFHGKNDGHKQQFVNKIAENQEILFFEQNEIIEKKDIFFEEIYNISLFSSKKIIVIKRVTDKITEIIKKITIDKLDKIIIILISDILEKKSSLRTEFEKNKKLISIAFYTENEISLNYLLNDFLKEKNIKMSQSIINKIIDKSKGERTSLLNELSKIEFYLKNKKKYNEEKILQLITSNEDYDFSEIIDNCLGKNKNKLIKILNEISLKNEDCVLIIRLFLAKLKRLLKLTSEYEKDKNINSTIAAAKPPIFWKDKEITKQQILKRKPDEIKEIIIKLNNLELYVKKNINNSVNVVTDFILEQSI